MMLPPPMTGSMIPIPLPPMTASMIPSMMPSSPIPIMPPPPMIPKPVKCQNNKKSSCPANYVCDTQKGYCVPTSAMKKAAKAMVPANLVPANIAYTMRPS